MPDILFKTDGGIFSYRVAGVLIRDGQILLQQAKNDPGYAFPGGHVNFGEPSEKALIREFKEELTLDIAILRLFWIGEIFFPWGANACHQICLYYLVDLVNEPPARLESKVNQVEFSWVDLDHLDTIAIYPKNFQDQLQDLPGHIKQFIYIEKQ